MTRRGRESLDASCSSVSAGEVNKSRWARGTTSPSERAGLNTCGRRRRELLRAPGASTSTSTGMETLGASAPALRPIPSESSESGLPRSRWNALQRQRSSSRMRTPRTSRSLSNETGRPLLPRLSSASSRTSGGVRQTENADASHKTESMAPPPTSVACPFVECTKSLMEERPSREDPLPSTGKTRQLNLRQTPEYQSFRALDAAEAEQPAPPRKRSRAARRTSGRTP